MAAVKAIPIPEYLLYAVPEIAPSLDGVDLDLTDKSVCLCPVHAEKTPSFRYYEDTNTCYCYGCGVGGDVINLHRRLMLANEGISVSFRDAVEYLYSRFLEEVETGRERVLLGDAHSGVHSGVLMFGHTVLNRASPENYGLAEDLFLLVKLGKISGEDAVAFYQVHRRNLLTN